LDAVQPDAIEDRIEALESEVGWHTWPTSSSPGRWMPRQHSIGLVSRGDLRAFSDRPWWNH
ncbi:MAG: hypothetical protein AAFU79_35025, partial [Myxococcota bacterium]